MGSKVVVLLCLVFAVVLLISSQVLARDLAEAEASNTADTTSTLDGRGAYNRGGGYGGGHGGGGSGGHGGGYGGGHGGGYGGGHGGGYGGGGRCYHGRCCRYGRCRCCNYAGENESAEFQAESHN